eukprot:gene23356-26438_t
MAADFEKEENNQFLYEQLKNDVSKVAKCDAKILLGRDGGYGWHDPFVPELTNGSTVALFRKPRNRLVSAFLFGSGMMIPPGHLHSPNETMQAEIFKYISNTTYPITHATSASRLTEESAASADLFYAMYGAGKPEPKVQPHTKMYRENTNHSKMTRTRLLEVLREQNWSDPPEQALYQHVRRIFYERCAKYNISTLERY